MLFCAVFAWLRRLRKSPQYFLVNPLGNMPVSANLYRSPPLSTTTVQKHVQFLAREISYPLHVSEPLGSRSATGILLLCAVLAQIVAGIVLASVCKNSQILQVLFAGDLWPTQACTLKMAVGPPRQPPRFRIVSERAGPRPRLRLVVIQRKPNPQRSKMPSTFKCRRLDRRSSWKYLRSLKTAPKIEEPQSSTSVVKRWKNISDISPSSISSPPLRHREGHPAECGRVWLSQALGTIVSIIIIIIIPSPPPSSEGFVASGDSPPPCSFADLAKSHIRPGRSPLARGASNSLRRLRRLAGKVAG